MIAGFLPSTAISLYLRDAKDANPPSRQIGMYDRIVKVDGELQAGGMLWVNSTNQIQCNSDGPIQQVLMVIPLKNIYVYTYLYIFFNIFNIV